MATATMTSKGQVTVPKDVRQALGLVPGKQVVFTRNNDGDYVITTKKHSIKRLAGYLKYDGPAKTLEEMEEGIAQGAAETMR